MPVPPLGFDCSPTFLAFGSMLRSLMTLARAAASFCFVRLFHAFGFMAGERAGMAAGGAHFRGHAMAMFRHVACCCFTGRHLIAPAASLRFDDYMACRAVMLLPARRIDRAARCHALGWPADAGARRAGRCSLGTRAFCQNMRAARC